MRRLTSDKLRACDVACLRARMFLALGAGQTEIVVLAQLGHVVQLGGSGGLCDGDGLAWTEMRNVVVPAFQFAHAYMVAARNAAQRFPFFHDMGNGAIQAACRWAPSGY